MSEQTSRQTEDTMATAQDLAVRDKKELVSKDEKTVPGRYYVPYADIYETDEVLSVVMEMPGVERKDIDVTLENNVLRIDGRIDFTKYEGMEPVYTEYNVGHYARSFTLSSKVDQGTDQCTAQRWCADADAAEGGRGPTAANFNRVTWRGGAFTRHGGTCRGSGGRLAGTA